MSGTDHRQLAELPGVDVDAETAERIRRAASAAFLGARDEHRSAAPVGRTAGRKWEVAVLTFVGAAYLFWAVGFLVTVSRVHLRASVRLEERAHAVE